MAVNLDRLGSCARIRPVHSLRRLRQHLQPDNVHRWFVPGVGFYARPDPLSMIRPGRLARLLRYAEDNPLRFYDPLGLDALTDNPDGQDYFFCLLKGANFGVSDFEKASWVTEDFG